METKNQIEIMPVENIKTIVKSSFACIDDFLNSEDFMIMETLYSTKDIVRLLSATTLEVILDAVNEYKISF